MVKDRSDSKGSFMKHWLEMKNSTMGLSWGIDLLIHHTTSRHHETISNFFSNNKDQQEFLLQFC